MIIKRIVNKIRRIIRKIRLRKVLKVQVQRQMIQFGKMGGAFSVSKDDITNDKNIIYSFGIGEDLSFSEDMMRNFDCEIYAFDPTPKAIAYVKNNKLYDNTNFHFYEYGLSDKDEIGHFHLPQNEEYVSGSLVAYEGVKSQYIDVELKCLSSIMSELGHTYIDVLKMDIEGTEFSVVKNIIESQIKFNQLCLEVHDRYFKDGTEMLKKMISDLNAVGYRIASVSKNMEELTFVKN